MHFSAKTFCLTCLILITAWIARAQSPSNDPYLDLYLGKGNEPSLFTINGARLHEGLGKGIALRNIPRAWGYRFTNKRTLLPVRAGYDIHHGLLNLSTNRISSYFSSEFSGSAYGEMEGDVQFRKNFSRSFSATILANGHRMNQKIDGNKDGFLDTPLKNRGAYYVGLQYKQRSFQNISGLYHHRVREQAGQLDFDPDQERLATNPYGYGVDAGQWGVFNNTYYRHRKSLYRAFLTGAWHDQDAYYGLRDYRGKQQTYSTDLVWDRTGGFTNYQAGVAFKVDQFTEQFDTIPLARKEIVTGVYGGVERYIGEYLRIRPAIRLDYHNLFDLIWTPRMIIDYRVNEYVFFNVYAGKGWRYPNIFTENERYWVSSREVVLREVVQPEEAWHYGAAADWKLPLGRRNDYIKTQLIFNRSDYINQVIVDAYNSARHVVFYNLDGRSRSNRLEARAKLVKYREGFGVDVFYRFEDVKASYGSLYFMDVPFYAKHRFYVNGYWHFPSARRTWLILNMSAHHLSKQRVPSSYPQSNAYTIFTNQSPSMFWLDARATLPVYTRFKVWVGVDNLTNTRQTDPFLNGDDPFGPAFDGSMQWGPVLGRRWYAGVSFITSLRKQAGT